LKDRLAKNDARTIITEAAVAAETAWMDLKEAKHGLTDVNNQIEQLEADKTNMEVQRDLAQDATEKEQFVGQLKEWASHNEEAKKVKEE